MMPTYHLTRFSPPSWDEAISFIIQAPDEATARALAQANGGIETRDLRTPGTERPFWTSKDYTACKVLDEPPAHILVRHFNHG